MLQLNKMKERWIREQAIDQGAIEWAMDVTSEKNERAMDHGASYGSGSNRMSDNYVYIYF